MASDPGVRRLARQMVGFDQRLRNLETVPQLAHSSLDDHGLPVYDADGNLTVRLGKQHDGTWQARPVSGPVPPQPVGVQARGTGGSIEITWPGTLLGTDTVPADFESVELLVDGALAGALHDPAGGSTMIPLEPGSYLVTARTRSSVPVLSIEVIVGQVTVTDGPDRLLIRLEDTTERADQLEADLTASKERITEAEGNITELETVTIPGVVETLEQADAAVRGDLDQLEVNLNGLASDVSDVTIAAGEAHDAAVAANERLEAVRADLGNGPSLWEDPGFERTQGGVPSLSAGRIERSQDWAASGTWAIRYTATGNGGNNFGSYGYVPATAGRWYMVTVTVHADAHEQCINTTWDARTAPTNTSADLIAYVLNPGETIVQPNETKTSTWYFQAPAGTKYFRYWIGQHSHANTADKVGQLVYLDDFRVVDVTDSYPQYLAAQQSAATAKQRADAAYELADAATTPEEVQTAILASANGKNRITVSTSAPSGSGVVVGDTWWRVDASGNVFGQWTWNGSQWSARQITNDVIANLDVHKLQVTGSATIAAAVIEKLWVDGLAARAVATMRLTVAPGNSFPDPYFQQPLKWAGGGREVVTEPDPMLSYLRITTGTAVAGAYFGGLLDRSVLLEPGASYRIRAQLRFSSTTADANRVRLIARGDTLTGVSGSNVEVVFTRVSSGVWETYEGILTVPSDRTGRFALGWFSVSPYVAAGTIDIRQVEVVRRVGAVLIEDGVINAPKVNAESVAAAVAAFIELDVANLRVIGTADIQEAVAQKLAAATASFQEAFIQNLRSNGAEIDEAVIGDLATNIITSGLFRTAETGQRWEIDSNGIVMYGVDDNGADVELVRLGPSGSNLITVGKTTVAPESIASPEGYFSSLAVGGLTLAEHLAQLPRGVIAWGQLTQNSDYDSSNTLVRRAELQVRLEPGRLYRIRLSTRYLQTTAASATFATEFLHYSWDGTPIIPNNIGAGVYQGTSGRQYVTTARAYSYPPLEFTVDTGGNSASRLFWCMYSIQSAAAVQLVAAANAPVIMSAEDLGPSLPGYLKRWNDNNAGGGQDPGPAPVQRYVKTYTSTGYRCYNENGTDAGRPDVVHGLYSGGPSHLRRRGGWLFPSMTGDLSGATVERIRMYIYCTQTYSSAGSTVNPAVWGGVMADNLATFTSRYGWKAETGQWIDLPTSLFAGFKSGQYAGVGVKPTSYGTEQYARFAPTGAQIEITYTK